jgi:molybdopterin molybdotransferase
VSAALAWAQAYRLAYDQAAPLAPGLARLADAVGCVLAEDLRAECDLPPADTSAMDGWAVCGPPPWRLVGMALAARAGPVRSPLTLSEAMVIATGAAVPEGTTGILRSERGAVLEGVLSPLPGVPAPDLTDVRPRGHEALAGDVLVPAGRLVHPVVAGLAAAAGHDALLVRPRPRVALLVLGDELLDEGPPRGGAVRDALGVQLPAWLEALGAEPGLRARVPDDPAATLAAIDAAPGDVVVTTGGSARGAADHVRTVLAELGARLVVDTVDVRPGHPMLLARLPDGRHLVALPGNPLAALTALLTLLAPLVAGLRGAPRPRPGRAPVAEDVSVLPGGRRPRGHLLVPVVREADGLVVTGHASASMLRGVAGADGLLLVPAAGLACGEVGEMLWFPWAQPAWPGRRQEA